ncbi:MAG: alanyl-tRNA editing protein [Candidatus Caldarchaeum sp.]|nr:alanyl-tRNA editing protein [Candidatus Caldarchaeum sp.]MDW8359996.1 alanyl-tRNA editing protein [Candidatus Caldarchaeum sp.]
MKQGATELLYLDDSYLASFRANVLKSGVEGVVLDRTAFHPRGGGLVSDTGLIRHEGGEARVVEVLFCDDVVHRVEGPAPAVGSEVECVLDWEKRYRIMRMHTGLHVLAATMVEKTNALITGNNVAHDVGRVDFSLESFDRSMMEECVKEANRRLSEGHPVKTYYMDRDTVLSTPGLVKLAGRLPPDIPVLRIVEIGVVDVQADGGPHVRNTSEVGRIEATKLENKGKSNRRMYFKVIP